MNAIDNISTTAGRGQVKGLYQVEKGLELHIVTAFGQGGASVEGNLYAILKPQQCKAFAEHLAEFSKNKTLDIHYKADIVGVRTSDAGRSEGRTVPKLHLEIALLEFSVEVREGMWK